MGAAKPPLPKIINNNDICINSEGPKGRAKKSIRYFDRPILDWTCTQFKDYFDTKHFEILGTKLVGGGTELSMLKILIQKRQDNLYVKECMDIFFGYHNIFKECSIKRFIYAGTQAQLDYFKRTGEFSDGKLKVEVPKDDFSQFFTSG